MPQPCIIFDLDGTLVDSERLSGRAFLELLPELDDTVETWVNRYRGKRFITILADMSLRVGKSLPDDFEKRYRQRVSELFSLELEPIEGVREMLDAIPYPYCVASNGPMFKINEALQATGLAEYFGDRIFSAYNVGVWKPHPGLFLFAANAMGSRPKHCLVIEDSEVGLEAAAAAEMQSLLYAPKPWDAVPAATSFAHMSLLPSLLAQFAKKINDLG